MQSTQSIYVQIKLVSISTFKMFTKIRSPTAYTTSLCIVTSEQRHRVHLQHQSRHASDSSDKHPRSLVHVVLKVVASRYVDADRAMFDTARRNFVLVTRDGGDDDITCAEAVVGRDVILGRVDAESSGGVVAVVDLDTSDVDRVDHSAFIG